MEQKNTIKGEEADKLYYDEVEKTYKYPKEKQIQRERGRGGSRGKKNDIEFSERGGGRGERGSRGGRGGRGGRGRGRGEKRVKHEIDAEAFMRELMGEPKKEEKKKSKKLNVKADPNFSWHNCDIQPDQSVLDQPNDNQPPLLKIQHQPIIQHTPLNPQNNIIHGFNTKEVIQNLQIDFNKFSISMVFTYNSFNFW